MNTDRKGAAMPDAELLPIHPVTGLRALGLLDDGRPVWPVMGGAEDDDDGDVGLDVEGGGTSKHAADEDDDLDDEADEDEGDAGKKAKDEWKPPTRDEIERMQKALTESNAEAKKYRLRLREVRAAQRTAGGKTDAEGTSDGDKDIAARVTQEAVEAAEKKYKPVAVRAAAMTALVKAEFRNPTDTRLNRMIHRLDMDELDVDFETGAVDGLEDQVEDLKIEFPELFGKDVEPEVLRQEKRRAPRINGANREAPAPKPLSTGEIHAKKALEGMQ